MKNALGFLGDKLFEVDEKQNWAEELSEFLSPKCFWVLFAEKVPNESAWIL